MDPTKHEFENRLSQLFGEDEDCGDWEGEEAHSSDDEICNPSQQHDAQSVQLLMRPLSVTLSQPSPPPPPPEPEHKQPLSSPEQTKSDLVRAQDELAILVAFAGTEEERTRWRNKLMGVERQLLAQLQESEEMFKYSDDTLWRMGGGIPRLVCAFCGIRNAVSMIHKLCQKCRNKQTRVAFAALRK